MQLPLFHRESLLVLLVYACSLMQSAVCCLTPLGYVGKVMPMSECASIQKLLEQYRDKLPSRLTTFVQMSLEQKENGQNMVCCGEAINLDEADGAAILRNFKSFCGDNSREAQEAEWEFTRASLGPIGLRRLDVKRKKSIGVRLGEHNILTDPDCENTMTSIPYCMAPVLDVEIEMAIPHNLYSKFTYDHDIALIRLKNVVEFETSVRPICLPGFQRDYDSPFGIISGWGATENNTHSNVLKKAHVPIFPIAQCQDVYRHSEIDWKHRICAAGSNDIHTCNGDSGGPLMIPLEGSQNLYSMKMRFMQVGIISLGTRTCSASRNLRSFPSVFTKVSAYMDWVEQNLEIEQTIEAHKKRTATNLAKSRNYFSPLIEYFRLG